jgi:hypothetical protein
MKNTHEYDFPGIARGTVLIDEPLFRPDGMMIARGRLKKVHAETRRTRGEK